MTNEILSPLRETETASRQKKAERVVNIGLFFNAALAVVKVLSGIVGHSQALLADGINSTSDVVYFIVVKIFVRISGKPPDSVHPYGHYQLESIAALVVGAFVITTGMAIFWDSIDTAFDLMMGTLQPRPIRWFTLCVALATIVIKIFLMLHASRAGKKAGNLAVKALAHDHRNDIFASAGAAVGIMLSMIGVTWVDPAAGALVAVVVAKTGFDILREASSDLMDKVPSEEIVNRIHELIDGIPSVETIEDIHAHRFGPYLVLNLSICVNGDLSVAAGDKIADAVESELVSGLEMLRKVYVHYHPAGIHGHGEAPETQARGRKDVAANPIIEYVPVLETHNAGDRVFIKSVLDAEGIVYYIQGEHVAPYLFNALPMRVMVINEQADQARELLKDIELSYSYNKR